MNIAKLAAGIPVVIIGALLLLEGILAYAADTTIWLESTNQANLTIAVGLIALLLGGSLLEDSRK
ncbi:MAG: hypothetical protein LN413_06160 [Candidatus Thermoplasmatota archaeon]|nr:hypothetical protein [Candidatus Thermoplasmatota archaeon]